MTANGERLCGSVAWERRDTVVSFVLCGVFLSLYLAIGSQLLDPMTEQHMTIDGSDSEAVIALLTRYESSYYKTGRHPLVLLVFNPIGLALATLVGSPWAALLLNTFFGGLLIAGCYVLYRCAGLPPLLATLFSLLIGLSSSHLVYASIPETFVFSAVSILALVLCAVLVEDPRRFLVCFVPLAVLAFGMDVSNLAPASIVLFFRFRQRRLGKRLLAVVALNLGVLVLAALLVLLQRGIWQDPRPFYETKSYTDPSEFFTLALIERPIEHLAEFGMPLFADVVVGVRGLLIRVKVYEDYFTGPHLEMMLQEGVSTPWRFAGLVGLAAFIAVAAVLCVRRRVFIQPLFQVLGSYLLVAWLFHLVYDPWEIFLFSTRFVFAWVSLLALSFRSQRTTPASAVFATVVAVLVGSSNLEFICKLLEGLSRWLSANSFPV